MADATRILVLGATGRVGGAALRHLTSAGTDLELLGGTRRPQAADELARFGVRPVALDLDDAASVEAAVQGVNALLLVTGYSVEMLRQSKRILDAARRAGVRHVVHVGASGHPTAEVAHWGWHRMVEAYIEQLGFTYTHLQPEAFMQNLTGFGWLKPGALTNLIGAARWSWVDAEDVGALAGAALLKPGLHAGRIYRLGYDQATMAELAEALARLAGTPVTLSEMDPAEFYEAAVASGADPAYMACVRDQFRMNAAFALPDVDTTFDPQPFIDAVGRAPARWPDYLKRAGDRLREALRT